MVQNRLQIRPYENAFKFYTVPVITNWETKSDKSHYVVPLYGFWGKHPNFTIKYTSVLNNTNAILWTSYKALSSFEILVWEMEKMYFYIFTKITHISPCYTQIKIPHNSLNIIFHVPLQSFENAEHTCMLHCWSHHKEWHGYADGEEDLDQLCHPREVRVPLIYDLLKYKNSLPIYS